MDSRLADYSKRPKTLQKPERVKEYSTSLLLSKGTFKHTYQYPMVSDHQELPTAHAVSTVHCNKPLYSEMKQYCS